MPSTKGSCVCGDYTYEYTGDSYDVVSPVIPLERSGLTSPGCVQLCSLPQVLQRPICQLDHRSEQGMRPLCCAETLD